MFNKSAVQGYFNFIKSHLPLVDDNNPDGMYFLPQDTYDSTLEFENELKSYVVENNHKLNLSKRPWIAIVWNRGVLGNNDDGLSNRNLPLLKRNTSNPSEPTGTIETFKQATCPLDVVYYSNNIDYIELLDEYIHTVIKNIPAFNIISTPISNSPTTISIKNFTVEEFTKEERTNYGEIVKLVTSLDLAYPIVLPDKVGVRKLIGRGKIEILYKILDLTEPFNPQT